MTVIGSKEDLRALSRRLGMVDAAAADVFRHLESAATKSVHRRIAVRIMRELGMSEEKIAACYGDGCEPSDEAPASVRRDAP